MRRATSVIATQGTIDSIRRYHAFDLDAPHSVKRNTEWVEQYRRAFERAVDDRTRSHTLIAAESSGGLDSASIVARLAEALSDNRAELQTYSLVAHQRELDLLDELTTALRISPSFKAIRPEILRVNADVERAITALGHPPEHGQPLLSAGFFEHAQDQGVRSMLSGFGGDEIVTSYAKHLIDELHHRREWSAVFPRSRGARCAAWPVSSGA